MESLITTVILTRIKGKERGACSFYDVVIIFLINVRRNKDVYEYIIFERD